MADQNCEIRESVDDDGSTFHYIVYCPLHAKAGELAEMLQEASIIIKIHKNLDVKDCEDCAAIIDNIEALLRHIEGETG